MPESPLALWYCDKVAAGSWSYALLLLPLLGAYFYGQRKQKIGWILIGVWLPLQFGLSFVNSFVAGCLSDAAPPGFEQPADSGGATQPEQPK
jgi:hypothetical protein